jgi:hypothetical protein
VTVVLAPAGGSKRTRRRALAVALAAAVALLGLGAYALVSRPGPEKGALYFTTYANQALYQVGFSFSGGRPQFGAERLVARLPAADGVTFEPDGDALVGGQGTGMVEEIEPSTGHVARISSGCPAAFLLALAPDGSTVYTAGLPAELCALPTDPLRPGHQILLHGDDTLVTDLAFDQSGQAFYTTGIVPGEGNFGLLDLSSGTTTRELSGIAAGHGIAFDPYSKTLFLFGGDSIFQIDPRHPQKVLSSMTVPGVQFDNGTTDGQGHLFVASNFGQLEVVDYHATDRLDAPGDVVTQVKLHSYLDDVAPLVGPGAAPGSRRWIIWAAVGLGALVLFALAIGFAPRLRFVSQLPSWDIRRQEDERRRRQARWRGTAEQGRGPGQGSGGRRPGRAPPGRSR